MLNSNETRELVREKYGKMAETATSCCGGGSCGDGSLAEIGYSADQAATIPDGANLGLGCGNPLAHAGVKPGETVLDLGSGAGIDVFLAAREVGPTGHVIGVDMTPAMIERARTNAAKGNFTNTEFRIGEIEHLPVADSTVDVADLNSGGPLAIRLLPDPDLAVSTPGDAVLRHDYEAIHSAASRSLVWSQASTAERR